MKERIFLSARDERNWFFCQLYMLLNEHKLNAMCVFFLAHERFFFVNYWRWQYDMNFWISIGWTWVQSNDWNGLFFIVKYWRLNFKLKYFEFVLTLKWKHREKVKIWIDFHAFILSTFSNLNSFTCFTFTEGDKIKEKNS